MLNVTDQYCISKLPTKDGFPVIRVICYESVIYVTGHVNHGSEAQGLLPRVTRQSETFFFIKSLSLFHVVDWLAAQKHK